MAGLRDIRKTERLDTGVRFTSRSQPLSYAEVAQAYRERTGCREMYPALAYSVCRGAVEKLRRRVVEDPSLREALMELLQIHSSTQGWKDDRGFWG